MNYYELIGYSASLLVALSLMMSNIWKLRWINLLGALIFSIYALLVKAYPVFAVNGFIAVVDIYYIVQLSKKKDYFAYIPVPNAGDLFLKKFLGFYKDDILRFFPDFSSDTLKDPQFIFILRNLIPVGLFVYETEAEGTINVKLDYVIPDYRDLKNAHYIYTPHSDLVRNKGIHKFIAYSNVDEHKKYLTKVGFKQDAANSTLFVKVIQ
ncbi:MAG: hypothetical protein ACM3S2_10105 [Ignavibacteriales bacterium]